MLHGVRRGEPVRAGPSVAPVSAGLLFDGDSFAAGALLSDPSTQGYPALVAAALGRVKIWNAGLGGQRIDEMEARFGAQLAGFASVVEQPVLIAEGGYNDIIQGADAATTFARWQTYMARARAAGFTRIVWLSMLPSPLCTVTCPQPHTDAEIPSFNALVVASGLADRVVDFTGLTISRQSDGLHPDAAGNAAMEPRITAQVASII